MDIEVVINHLNGIHAKVAYNITQLCCKNKAHACLSYGDKIADCESVYELLMLDTIQGSRVVISSDNINLINQLQRFLSNES